MAHSIRRYNTDLSTRSDRSRHSESSQDSQSTAPTSYYSNSPRPSLHQAATDRPIYSKQQYDISPGATSCPRSSAETYTSSIASQEELFEEPDSYDPDYEVPEYQKVVERELRPSTHSDFANYFPSTRRLFIRHDDTTYDGNMNLRVDTEGRKKESVQLFHMRLHDLKKREFSLRRYERSSGREVCHSSRKYAKPAAEKRPAAITRSVSNAFASIGKPGFKRTNSGLSTHSNKTKKEMRRQDSGYGSGDEYDGDDDFFEEKKSKSIPIPTNTTKLEFSNYAHIEVKRRGAKSSKRYQFEYWGHNYFWKRVTEKDGHGKAVSYHLYKEDNGPAVAHIVPEMRSPSQIREEEEAGEWVPPCSMWISDKSVLEALTDVADVIVATGLIALVDDCIKRHFHSKGSRHSHHTVPLTPLDIQFVTPKAMVEHYLNKRRNSSGSNKEREQRGSPLKFANHVIAY